MCSNIKSNTNCKIFTFQSGDIQIKKEIYEGDIISLFTFQSGDIQIRKSKAQRRAEIKDLHSNLVIFKCRSWYYQCIIWETFTFQSGDIQIKTTVFDAFCWLLIYIPIWWYSNSHKRIDRLESQLRFTFQSGDIQINTLYIYMYNLMMHLHSNLVIFKLYPLF